MTASHPDALSQSVKQRLLNLSQQQREPFNPLLIRYGIERLLYRLTQTPHAGDFVLKGATLFAVWAGKPHRPTQDVDLLGFGAPDVDRLVRIFREVCLAEVVADGLTFDPGSVRAAAIREGNIYDGVRVRLDAALGKAKVPIQVDVGFGDAITPEPSEQSIGPMLDFPAPVLRAYRPETVVAEKLHAMIVLGMANSRMKDYFDLWTISRTMIFDGPTLALALAATFERRETPLPSGTPVGLTPAFAADAAKRAQWVAFCRKMGPGVDAPELADAVAVIGAFVGPVLRAAAIGDAHEMRWTPTDQWRPLDRS